MNHTHSNDSLYPRSIYLCSDCGTMHGTRSYGGAVNWQCPRTLVLDANYHEPKGEQVYIGYFCSCGEAIDTRQAPGFIIPTIQREQIIHGYRVPKIPTFQPVAPYQGEPGLEPNTRIPD